MKASEIEKLLQEFTRVDMVLELVPVLKKMPLIEVSELIAPIDDVFLLSVLDQFKPEQQGQIVAEFPVHRQLSFFQSVSKKRFVTIFENMPSENRADFYLELSSKEQTELLPYLPKKVREDVIKLSSYPPETAGGIMSTDFATVQKDMTCAQAIDKVRSDSPSKKTIYYVYVVDDEQRLLGFITLKDLIIATPQTLVEQVTHSDFINVSVEEDREDVAKKIEKYDLVAIPVVNSQGQLVGIVTHDEAIDVIRAEQTEDLEKFMGIVPGSDVLNYTETSVLGHFRKRVVWLSSLAIIGLISGIIIHSYEEALSVLIILALYMPMVADTGGNTGSQAATVVIRALALGQITVKNWLSILFKEARISILLAGVLGLIAFGKVLFLSWETEVPEQFSLLYIAIGISGALSLQVITATVLGAALPLIVKRLGGDPAVAASPAITTMVDITGLLIYFGVATLLFF